MTDQIPQTPVKPVKRSLMDRVSIVWVVPIVALLIALGIAWQAYQERGPLIEISFENASGIVAEQTQLRYREVSVGVVEEVAFSADLSHVVAHVRLDKEVEHFVDSEALFWVVQPEVSARGITGLQTVLSGVYIEGSWDNEPGGLVRHFEGLSERPVSRPDQKGTRITLSSRTGKGLDEGAPILFKGLQVGQIGTPVLSADGVTITAEAFVDAPHDQLMTTRTRFWSASGISFNIGPAGASIDVENLSTLINGGIVFETVVSGGSPVSNGQPFAVFENQDQARQSLFDGDGPTGGTLKLAMVFEDNVMGLEIGAPVMLEGLQIGEVIGLTGKIDPEQFGDERVRLYVVLSLELDQLEMPEGVEGQEAESEAILDFFALAVEQGWRAKLVKSGFLSSDLHIEMQQTPDAAPAWLIRDADPYPIFPSVLADLDGAGGSAEGLLERVRNLPIEDLMTSATSFMDNAARLVASEDIQQIPAEVRGAVQDVREAVGSADVEGLSERVGGIADEVLVLLEDIKSRQGIDKLVEAIDNAGAAAAEIGVAAEAVPELIQSIEALADKANALDLDGLLEQVKGLAGDAGEILATDATKALPQAFSDAIGSVEAALVEATAILSELNEGGAATALSDTLENVNAVASDISTATQDVPGLIEDVREVAAKAAAMELEELVSEVTGLVESAEALIGTDAARQLPVSLNQALDEVGTALAELREGGTVEAVNAALSSAEQAADSVAQASSELPELVKRTEAVLREAELALAGLSDSGALNREARATLREVSRAADSVRSLMRTLERKPNALLTGK